MSSDAMACPRCGKPNKRAMNKTMDSKQSLGCLLLLLSLLCFFLLPPVGVVMFIVGLVIFLINTRVW